MEIREPYREGIAVYHHPNPQIRSYLLEEAISSMRVEHLKGPLTAETMKSLAKLGLIGSRVAKEILDIQGVYEIRIKPKEVWIKKVESSSWDELEGKIFDILGRALRRKKIRPVTRSGH